jgi:trimeric autotransporter adhesin
MKRSFFFIPVFAMGFMASGQPLTGTKSIPGDYTNIQSAIADLNSKGVGSGGVIFNVEANHTETLATSTAGLITATGNASDTIVFRKNPATTGNNPLITAFTPGTSTTADGMIKIAGGDYITIDGIDLQENPANNSFTTWMEWGYAMVKKQNTVPFDGCQHVTIINCTITLTKNNRISTGIYAGNHIATNTTYLTITATTDAMNDVKIDRNTISNVFIGILLAGYAHPYPGPYTLYDHDNQIGVGGGNHISNFGGSAGGTSYYAYGIHTACQQNLQVANNVINGGAGTARYVYGINIGTGSSSNCDIYNNDISVSGSGYPLYGIHVDQGGAPTGNTVNIHDNLIHDCGYSGTSSFTFYAISQVSHVTYANIYNNQIYNNLINTTGNFYGILGCDDQVTYLNMYGNQIHDNQITGAGGTMFCMAGKNTILSVHDNDIYNNSFPASAGYSPSRIYGYFNDQSPAISEEYYNNHIYNLSIGGTSTYTGSIFGIYTKSAGTSVKNISGNLIHGFHISSPGGGITTGIHNWGGNLISIQNNEIFDLETDNADALSYGIDIQYGTTVNMYNNFISDIRTPQSYYGTGVKGIYLEGGGTLNLFYNTIFLNASSSTTLRFGAAGIVASASPTVDLRNNLVVNLSTPVHISGNAYTSAYVRTQIVLTNYAVSSNNNCFYAGTPDAYNVIFWDGTNTDSTMEAFRTRVSPRDADSFSENPPFPNDTAAPYDLHLNTSTPTGCESGGKIVTSPGCNVDFEGDPRYPESGYAENPSCPATAPDVGADEFDGIQANLLTWTGAVSADWSDPGNWTPAAVPGAANSVVIPSGTGNDPQVLTSGQSCRDLIIKSGAEVSVAAGIQLIVHGHTLIKE